MIPQKAQLIRSAMDVLYYTGAYNLFAPAWSGVGAIFMLHHVRRSYERGPFSPNHVLEVTPEFVEQTIEQVLEHDYEIISLDEVQRRLTDRDFERKFACFTLDDGYVDNYLNAFPVFRKYKAPFTIYVQTGLPDGMAVLWWWLLEEIVRDNNEIEFHLNGRDVYFETGTMRQKTKAFDKIYWEIRLMTQADQRVAVEALLSKYKVDPMTLCQSSAMSWGMVKELAGSKLATIGAHTISHPALARLRPEEVYREVAQSRDIIMEHIGKPVRHFAYPYGDPDSASSREFEIIRDLGFATATTTRKGVLYPAHAQHLHALPRVPLHGSYQNMRYVDVYLSGAPVALWRGFRRLDVN